MSHRGIIGILLPTALAITISSCHTPAVPDVPSSSAALHVLAILEGGATAHPMNVWLVAEMSRVRPPEPHSEIYRVPASDSEDKVLVSTGHPGDSRLCNGWFGISRAGCVVHELSPRHGATYRLTVSAENRPVATATVTMPGEFRILGGRAEGTPAGTDGLVIDWSDSEGAFRYAVGVQPETAYRCIDFKGCEDSWFVFTRESHIDTVIPAWVFKEGEGSWYVDIWAMSESMYRFLTTGHGGYFPVPPVSNVENGYGMFGAVVVHSARLPGSEAY